MLVSLPLDILTTVVVLPEDLQLVKQYANRPYDGQVVFIDQLYNQLDKIDIVSVGDGFVLPQ